MNYDNWLIIEVASEPTNAILASWLAELLVRERDVSSAVAARFVTDLQELGRAAAEMLVHTKPTICSVRE